MIGWGAGRGVGLRWAAPVGAWAIGMAVGAWGAGLARAAETADNIFDIDRRPAQRALVTLGPELPIIEGPHSAMTLRLKGVLADLDRLGVRQLRGLPAAPVPAGEFAEGAGRVCFVQLFAGAKARNIEILRSSAGSLAARELEGDEPGPLSGTLTGIDGERFLALSAGWSAFRGEFDSPPMNAGAEIAPGAVVELARPYSAGWLRFDKETLSRRFLRNRETSINAMDRPLGENAIWVRLPRGYEARKPWGLLVWINAGYLGQPPEVLHAACDELGLVCVGPAGAGNDRDLANRCQLIFDAAATACERFHIDRERIYATGISGGGKISSMLWACFPDVFAGAVPVVGLACYENMPIGNGQFWPGNFNRPEPATWAVLKSRRAGAITGNKDFNYEPMHAALRVFQRDGLTNVRLYVQQGMAHEMPSVEQFMEAMMWVDEPRREARDAEEKKAAALMEKYRKGEAASDAEKRKRLVEVTEAAPWSAAAWEAVGEMGRQGEGGR